MSDIRKEWLETAALFSQASLDGEWMPALEAFGAVCGAERSQLIGVGADRAVPFNWINGADPEPLREFEAMGGGDPLLNPRVREGVTAPLLKAWHDLDCFDDEVRATSPEYCDFCIRYDLPYGSQATLMRDSEMLIGMSTLRRARDGLPGPEDRQAFEFMVPHVRDAVRMQMTLEGRGAALIAGALEALGAAAFVCDAAGKVRAHTAAAEAVVAKGVLRLRAGRLGAAREPESRNLEAVIEATARGEPDPRRILRTLVLHGPADGADSDGPILVDVMPLPRQPYAFGFEPRVLVAVRGSNERAAAFADAIRQTFGLTDAEAQIAVRLADGDSREAIAMDRGVSLLTVRSQIKALFSKTGVRRATELSAKLNRFR